MWGVGGAQFHHVSWPSLGEELVLRGYLLWDVTVSASLDGLSVGTKQREETVGGNFFTESLFIF